MRQRHFGAEADQKSLQIVRFLKKTLTMKTLLPLGVLLLLVPVHCDPVMSVENLSSRNADFGARLFQAVASRSDKNVAVAPFILSAGLMVLLSATTGPSQEQLLYGLTLNGVDAQTIPDQFQTLRTSVLDGGQLVNLRQGAAIFPAQSFQVASSYLDQVQTKFSSSVQNVDYTTPLEAVDTLNRWAQDQTGDQVQDLVPALATQTQLLLAAVASYQTSFQLAFNASMSQVERFFVDKYHVVMVTMMSRTDKYFLAYDRSAKAGVLRLSMTDGAAMLVVLPDEEVDITTVEEVITGEKIQAWIKQLKKTKLEVQLPRFQLEQGYALKDVLQRLDITQVFQDDAGITNMGVANAPKLDQVFHKSVISVDERGGEVAAGGGVGVLSAPPPRLTINRPFIFIVYHERSGSLMLMGRVQDPSRK